MGTCEFGWQPPSCWRRQSVRTCPPRRAIRSTRLVDDRLLGTGTALRSVRAEGLCDLRHCVRAPDGPTELGTTSLATTFTSLLLGRDPITGDALASQPTISRFENDVGSQELYAMGQELAMSVIERHQRRRRGHARRVTIDLDPTDDATHGAQQLTFFNKYYDRWCYLPLLAFLTFDDETEQYLCAAVLRPGNVPATRGAVGVLQRLLALLRLEFPQARFLVRLDGGFATPEIFDVLDAEPGLDYVVAMAKNSVLVRDAEPAMAVARGQSEASGQTEHVYTDVQYAAGTWAQARRVVIKAEVVQLAGRAPQDNPRFVVTNLRQTPRFIYERIYCARGDIENRIKELHDGLQIGRPSCCRFWANQLRVFFTAAAYVLMQELRLRAAGTACARTQVTWLRDRLLKLGGPRLRLGAPHRPPPADGHPGPPRVAAHRPRARRPPRLARTFAPPSRVTGLRETAHGGAVRQAARNGPSAQSFDQRGLHSTAATSDPSVAIRSHRPGNRSRTLYE